MSSADDDHPRVPGSSRRRFLGRGLGLVAASTVASTFGLPGAAYAAGATAPPDDTSPYPIPWLDPNLHHNQVPTPGGPPTELSHIFHFKGQVGRALFTGEGKTGDGKTLYIGKGTDYGYSSGTYLTANGDARVGAFGHI